MKPIQFYGQLLYLNYALSNGASKEKIRNRLERLVKSDISFRNIIEDPNPIQRENFTTTSCGVSLFCDLANTVKLPYEKRSSLLVQFAKYYFLTEPCKADLPDRITELINDIGITKIDVSEALLQAYDERLFGQ